MDAKDLKSNLPIIFLYGPTASGKSDAAIRLALQCGGEIICADSRTIYKGMDIGTAKPSVEDQSIVPHHLLDIIEPDVKFSAYDFKLKAVEAIAAVHGRGRIPIITGGTGLYMDSVLFNFTFKGPSDPYFRKKLENMTLDELHKYCLINNIELPENKYNKRYVVANIERRGALKREKTVPISTSIIVGITTDTIKLRKDIEKRVEHMFEHGVVEEAIKLGKIYGWSAEAMTGNVYRVIRDVIENTTTIEQAKQKCVTLDWRLAKRQRTWLRRNAYIQWTGVDEVEQIIISKIDAFNLQHSRNM